MYRVKAVIKVTLFLHLAYLCLDLGLGENEHPTGKFGSDVLLLLF